jgi:hypothetical protein
VLTGFFWWRSVAGYRVFPSLIESNHRLTPSTRCLDVHAFEMMLNDASHNNA